jgi:tetratricopeptide (TPR) repeat protein
MKKLLVGMLIVCAGCALAQQRRIDSLTNALQGQKKDSAYVTTLNDLSRALLDRGEFVKALGYIETAKALSAQLGFRPGLGIAYNNCGTIYLDMGDAARALKEYLEGLKIFEASGDLKNMARLTNNIGNVYLQMDNILQARHYYESALELKRKIADKKGIATAYTNIANTYIQQADFARGIDYSMQALKIKQELGDELSIAITYNNLGIIFREQGEYGKALDYFQRSLVIREKKGDQEGIGMSCNNIGTVYTRMKEYDKANQYLQRGLSVNSAMHFRSNTQESYQGLTRLSEARGDFKAALAYFKLNLLYIDSLVNDENTRKAVQTQMQYEFEKQQAADSVRNAEQLKQEELKHDQEIGQQRIYTYGGAAAFALMLVVALISIRAYRQKQKANEIISAQKLLVEEKQKEVLDSIYYARRIQRSQLPSEKYIQRALDHHKHDT